MSILTQIYYRSPVSLQNLFMSGVGYRKNRSRYGTVYYDYRKFLSEFDSYTLAEQQAYQNQELIRFIRFAYENSPFYRELYKDVDLGSLTSVADLKRLPIVDKEMLRQNIERVNTIPRSEAIVHHTSGSTGKPFEAFLTKEDMMRRSAQLDHFKSRIGFENLKMRKASFSGHLVIPYEYDKQVFWRYNSASKQMMYSSYHLSEENMGYYVESLNRFKPMSMDGYFSSMVLVADYIERHGLTLNFKPIALFPTAETVNEPGKKLLERVFQCKVYDQYASSEGAPFVTACSHQHLHMELASGVFEHLEEGRDEILVTSFTTHGTPLIRYRIGDLMTFEDEKVECACGSKAPMVKSIEGRSLDYLVNADGQKLYIAHVLGVLEVVPYGLIQVQFIQNKIDEIILHLQIDENLFEQAFIDKMQDESEVMFGKDTKLTIDYVDNIPKEKNGKFRILKNNLTG